ncbi:GYDIA family GHMP kinase [Gramella lutea]|uniref:GYDIA family GHMP kinase n=1 Tax=Christiangramia lutea TaxID=1607951 RepID=A0A9X1V6C0_9FLAO|nr:GYDIA family GHMP kinase [Christiangramia lutea]MCH4824496.1 GYDIA family GHMP kinase [Christiangramia lutea]
MLQFRSNGKLLITGEYAVLDGAKSLAVPTSKGQEMRVDQGEPNLIDWKGIDEKGDTWFQTQIRIDKGKFNIISTNNEPETAEIEKRLQQIFISAYQLNSKAFLDNGYNITTVLDFNRKWGLGTSSTLISNLAQWLNIDPYKLLESSFGGSGYDIAVAGSQHPVSFQLTKNGPSSFTADFNPVFKDDLFFVYLNRKQNSREAIAHYKQQTIKNREELVEKISGITEQVIKSEHLAEFEMLLKAHETLISKAINLPRIKTQLFQDYPKLIKSLGGWGGDFIMATGREDEKEYFRRRGYNTIFNYSELIK